MIFVDAGLLDTPEYLHSFSTITTKKDNSETFFSQPRFESFPEIKINHRTEAGQRNEGINLGNNGKCDDGYEIS